MNTYNFETSDAYQNTTNIARNNSQNAHGQNWIGIQKVGISIWMGNKHELNALECPLPMLIDKIMNLDSQSRENIAILIRSTKRLLHASMTLHRPIWIILPTVVVLKQMFWLFEKILHTKKTLSGTTNRVPKDNPLATKREIHDNSDWN